MINCFFAFILLLFVCMEASAQRHGRADAIENYMLGGPPHPELLLQIWIQGKRLYFRGSDLRRMQRTVVTLSNSSTRTTHTYEGVDFETLIPNSASQSGSQIIQVNFGLHQIITILTSDLDPAAKPMVVDAVDRKKVSNSVPYLLIVKTHRGNASPLKDVKLITARSSSE